MIQRRPISIEEESQNTSEAFVLVSPDRVVAWTSNSIDDSDEDFISEEDRITAAYMVHSYNKFEGLVKALGKATTIIVNEYPVDSEEYNSALKLRELLVDAREVKEI